MQLHIAPVIHDWAPELPYNTRINVVSQQTLVTVCTSISQPASHHLGGINHCSCMLGIQVFIGRGKLPVKVIILTGKIHELAKTDFVYHVLKL